MGEIVIKEKAVNVHKLGHEPKSYEYWLSQPAEKRIEAIEYLRSQFYSEDEIKSGIQRVCRIIKLSQS